MNVDISSAVKVSGWMKQAELEWLAQQAKKCERILEVGSYHGRSTIAMLDNSDAHIWCVDAWDSDTITNTDYRTFLANTENYHGRLTVLRGDGAQMLAQLERDSVTFNMAFVDDGHAYAFAHADIKGCMPLLSKGALLCGHDYSNAWPGVKKAVDELVPGFKKVNGTSIWWKRI